MHENVLNYLDSYNELNVTLHAIFNNIKQERQLSGYVYHGFYLNDDNFHIVCSCIKDHIFAEISVQVNYVNEYLK